MLTNKDNRKNLNNFFKEILSSILAIIFALIIGAIIIYLMGESPFKAYSYMISGAFGSTRDFANTISKSIPLVFTGLSVAIAFRTNIFNIGAEGQLLFGALCSILFALKFPNLSKIILMPITFLVGILGGMIIGAIPGIFKSRLKINEVIVGIMLNYIVTHYSSFLVNGPLKDAGTVAQTKMISTNARLSKLVPRTQLTTALLIMIFAVVIVYIFLWKTNLGYKIRAVGVNSDASEAAGINSKKITIFSMCLSGTIASLAGITEVLGKQYRFIEGFSPSFGFTGIAVAVLGKNHPIGVILSAFLFGALDNGALRMSRETIVSSSIVLLIQSLVILFVSAPKIFEFIKHKSEDV